MKGFISIWLMLFITIFVIGAGIFVETDTYKVALAEDIAKGKLVLNPQAQAMLVKADKLLEEATKHESYTCHTEYSLYEAFIAKVWYERARLSMEITND